jgi:NitT/TauT family transport system permease protein
MNKKYLLPAILFTSIILVWQASSYLLNLPEFLLPSPASIAISLYHNLGMILFPHFFVTFLESLLGFILAILVSLFLILIFDFSPNAKLSIYPYLVAIKITPIVAIAPFLIIWLGNGLASKIVAAMLYSFFTIILNLTKGFEEVESEYLDLMKSFSASKWKIFTKLKFPNASPYLFSGLKMSWILAVSGAIFAEFIGSNKGLGFLIINGYYYLNTSLMFATLFVTFIGGMFFFSLIGFIEKRFYLKYNVGGKDNDKQI